MVCYPSSRYANFVLNDLWDKKSNLFKKAKSLQMYLKFDLLKIFGPKGKVYENGWRAEDFDQLTNKIRLCLRNMDQNLIHLLLASTSSRLNKIRRLNLIEKRWQKNKLEEKCFIILPLFILVSSIMKELWPFKLCPDFMLSLVKWESFFYLETVFF